jgi:hypothetical protein
VCAKSDLVVRNSDCLAGMFHSMYLSQGQIALATELLIELRSKGVKPNMETYTVRE